MLGHLYRVRLRSHLAQELLAGSGIAVGVALVFGVLVANTSLTSSAGALIHQVIGSARLELAARSPQGFQQSVASEVQRLHGVRASAAVLRENVSLLGPKGRQPAQMLGVSGGIVALGSFGVADLGAGGFRFSRGVLLPAQLASELGVGVGSPITLLATGVAHRLRVGAVLSSATFGALASSPVVVTMLPVAQQLTSRERRVTQLLVEPDRGADSSVRAELRRVAGNRLDVTSADNELRLLDEAAKPNGQSTELFSAISVMVGFLLALNAMLLTVPERRRFVADLRIQGYDRRQVLLLLSFQAAVLGVVASLAGLALGDLFSTVFLHRVPTYLATAFPIGAQQVVHTQTVALAFGCGLLAALLASLAPMLDLRDRRPVDEVFREAGSRSEVIAPRATIVLGCIGIASAVLVTVLVLLAPRLTIVGGVVLALSTLCLIPPLFAWIARALPRLSEHVRSGALVVAVSELRATSVRSVALAGIAGLAVYGSIAIGGARGDLIRGLDGNFSEYLRTADIWVTTGDNSLPINEFRAGSIPSALRQTPGIASVHEHQGGLLDVGARRMWVVARPPADASLIPASQLLHGNLEVATARLRAGGWAAVSSDFASERHLHVGGAFSLPTPTGYARLRLAAITTNLGWPPGAIVLSTIDYRRYWQSVDPTALEVDLAPGVSLARGRRLVEQVIAGQASPQTPALGQPRAGAAGASGAGPSGTGVRAAGASAAGVLGMGLPPAGASGTGALGLGLGVPGLSGTRRGSLAGIGSRGREQLGVQTFPEREKQYAADSRQGLEALSQISMLLLIAAALAVASALSASIWHRRPRLASLKIQGYDIAQLWRALLLESAITLGTGCIVGAAMGVYGHALAGRWLRLTTGFAAPFAVGPMQAATTLALVTGIALAVVALPGLAAARVPAHVSFQD